MTCKRRHHQNVKKFGVYGRKRTQRYRCRDCSATFSEPVNNPLGPHTIEFDKAVQIVRLLMEGMTIRGISRVTGIHKDTITSGGADISVLMSAISEAEEGWDGGEKQEVASRK